MPVPTKKKSRITGKMFRKATVDNLKSQLEAGNNRFDRIEKELKETNGLLRELLGMFKMTVPPVKTLDELVKREG